MKHFVLFIIACIIAILVGFAIVKELEKMPEEVLFWTEQDRLSTKYNFVQTQSLSTLNIKIVDSRDRFNCPNPRFAYYLPDRKLAVFSVELLEYPPEIILKVFLHEVCHHLTYVESDSVLVKEIKANQCMYMLLELKGRNQ